MKKQLIALSYNGTIIYSNAIGFADIKTQKILYKHVVLHLTN